ncbi:MAG: hypothetical protein ACRDO2_04470, partial [Nocardioidaceae bacterium]
PPQGQSPSSVYGQPPYQQSAGQHTSPQSYGRYPQQTYAGSAAAWPVTTSAPSSGSSALSLVTTILLALGGLLGLGYAVWAFTARRGIFADFADGVSVSADDARSSDQIDTIFVIIAGLVALAALVLWVVQKAAGKTAGGALELGGLAAAGVGVVLILVGLVLSAGVADGGTTAEQGDKGVTATLVLGAGFTVLAVGLLIGLVTARGASAKRSSGGW